MIRVEGLCASVGGFLLHEVTLSVEAGQYCAILGPSGAGKSVLLETLIGLHPPSNGRVLLDGRDVTRLPPEDRSVAYVPQDLALFPHLGVLRNITFGARARRLKEGEIKLRLQKLVELLNIGHLLERRDPATLSIGEQQRVAIARALIVSPRVLFLDEPFSALDDHLTRQLQIKLRDINREFEITIVHVTHDREEAFILGDRIAVMIDGAIMQSGDRDDIYYRPANLEVARFLLNQNIFSGKVKARDDHANMLTLAAPGIEVEAAAYNGLRPGQRVHFGIRPEEIMIIRHDRPLGPQVSRNLFRGRVDTIFEKGGSHLLWVRVPGLPDPLEVDIPNRAFRDMDLKKGDELKLSLKMNSIWSIPESPQVDK